MKKVIFALVMLFVAIAVFAQSYTVESVTGRVQRDAGGRMVEVRVGDVLVEDTVIRTAVGASLVLNNGINTVTIPAGRNGKIEDLIDPADGARIGGNVSRVDTGAVSRTTGQVSTASARASVARAPRAVEEDEEEEQE